MDLLWFRLCAQKRAKLAKQWRENNTHVNSWRSLHLYRGILTIDPNRGVAHITHKKGSG
jgi:hypothetical protein